MVGGVDAQRHFRPIVGDRVERRQLWRHDYQRIRHQQAADNHAGSNQAADGEQQRVRHAALAVFPDLARAGLICILLGFLC